MDRESGRWVDGDSLRLRVSCWRKLAEGVSASIAVGDPVVVMGRIYTRDWTDSEGNARVSYEMEAAAVGHDLARGKAKFFRTRPTATDAATGPEADSVVRGEAAELVPGEEVPVGYGEGIPEVEEPAVDPLTALLNREPVATGPVDGQPVESQPLGDDPAMPGDLEIEVEALVEQERREQDGREQDGREQDGREQDSREQDSREQDGREQDGREQEGREQDGGEPGGRRRSRRAPKREPIPA
jgi:single-strand DNA-binding protein